MPADTPETLPAVDEERVKAQLRRWQERLLDLTKANPLLGINRSRVSKLRVSEPNAEALFDEFLLGDRILDMPVVRKERSSPTQEHEETSSEAEPTYVIEHGDIAFEATPSELARRLRRIYDNARTTVEERGLTTLYLTLGTMKWNDPLLGESVAPLWMVPCELDSPGPSAPLRLARADEDVQLNPALELYLREREHIVLPPLPEEPKGGELAQFLDAVRAAVRERGWKIDGEVWLSTFTFETLVIYQDIKALADLALRHAVVVALSRAATQSEGSEALPDDSLDELPAPAGVTVPVLPADSSQLQALVLAVSGRNIVIHGPPGTGKSQTIANMIADALGRNKTVLFVSAKMAALNVVYERLAHLGLGRFCLEAHSAKAGKAKIIEELKRTLDSPTAADEGRFEEQLSDFVRLRIQLNDYVRDLHSRREPLGRSVYQVIGRAERLRAAPDVAASLPWTDPLAVPRHDLATVLDALSDVSSQAAVFDRRASHPWRGCTFSSASGCLTRQEEFETELRALKNGVQQIAAQAEEVAKLVGADLMSASIGQLNLLVSALSALGTISHLPREWAVRPIEDLGAGADLLKSAAANASELKSKSTELKLTLNLPASEVARLLAPISLEFASVMRVLRPRYWSWLSSVRHQLRHGARSDLTSIRSYLALASRLAELEAWFAEHLDALRSELPTADPQDSVALARIAEALAVARQLREQLAAARISPPLTSPPLTPENHKAARALLSLLEDTRCQRALAQLDAAWGGGFVEGTSAAIAPAPLVFSRCTELLAALPNFHEWFVLQHTLGRCADLGLDEFLLALGETSATDAPSSFERRFLASWVNAAIQVSSGLAVFAGVRREEQIARFRSLDESIRRSALEMIKAAAAAPARRLATARSEPRYVSEVSVLRRELEKRRHIKPLRKLFAEIPHALQALKPCLLMSPISVSTFLRPDALFFDVVIFDEASQLPTPEAIPSIVRARQAIVAGDANQLPPTAFFEASVIFDEERVTDNSLEELEPLESLLDDAVSVVPAFERTHLKWHYRSRDERLIKFSNQYFYDNMLTTFPSASTSGDDCGVRLEYVPHGIWDRGRSRTNRQEAGRVAQVIVEQLAQYPDRSLGVVALNVNQREAIEEALEEAITEQPELVPLLDRSRPEPFFIKALENVQGDERDTMIISVGYAKAADGALSLNFGPLNREGGWRRLNVLVTRARWETILVTSMHSHDLAAVNPNNRGAVALWNFISYCERRGELPLPVAGPAGGETNDFEDAVAEALRERGFDVDQQVGASAYRIDLAIRDPRNPYRYVLGIECDGATYHSAKTARDRDLLRQQVLREHGWRLHRVWSTDWFRDREKALRSLFLSVEFALKSPSEDSVPAAPQASPPEGCDSSSPTTRRSEPGTRKTATDPPIERRFLPGEAYRKCREVGSHRGREYLLSSRLVGPLSQQIVAIARFEGPIHEEVLAERLKEVNSVERAGVNVQSNINRGIDFALQTGAVDRIGSYLVAKGDQPKTFRVPGDGVSRSLGFISPEEIELAILYLVEDQFGFQREALPQAISRSFGLERTRIGNAELVGNVVDGLIERGVLRLSGPNVYIVDPHVV